MTTLPTKTLDVFLLQGINEGNMNYILASAKWASQNSIEPLADFLMNLINSHPNLHKEISDHVADFNKDELLTTGIHQSSLSKIIGSFYSAHYDDSLKIFIDGIFNDLHLINIDVNNNVDRVHKEISKEVVHTTSAAVDTNKVTPVAVEEVTPVEVKEVTPVAVEEVTPVVTEVEVNVSGTTENPEV